MDGAGDGAALGDLGQGAAGCGHDGGHVGEGVGAGLGLFRGPSEAAALELKTVVSTSVSLLVPAPGMTPP